MNKPLAPAKDDAIEVEATEATDDAAANDPLHGIPETSYARSTRDRAIPALSGLLAVKTLKPEHRSRLETIVEALNQLLDIIEKSEQHPEQKEPEWQEKPATIDTSNIAVTATRHLAPDAPTPKPLLAKQVQAAFYPKQQPKASACIPATRGA